MAFLARRLKLKSHLIPMNTNLLNKSVLTINSNGIGEVSEDMLHKRAVELAIINSRTDGEPSPLDWEQARRELTGESELDPQETFLESAPEGQQWDPAPGTRGQRALVTPDETENAEGESLSADLVEEGIREAEHDQMLKASKV